MALRLYDTQTHQVQPVVPSEPGHVRLYSCGPTVWNRAHIGNFRTFVAVDVLRRVLEQRFDRVTHVMNLTDVDDRIVRNAMAHGHSLEEETRPWIEAFFRDIDTLGIRRAHAYPRATEYIEAMVTLVEELERRGYTYRSDGSIYFRISAFPEYGRLSGVRPEGLVAGGSGRVDADDYGKEDVRDFALWKAVGEGEPGWDTRLGRGRPGWHLECSAMNLALLGETIDIHAGGVDLVFPHHENEIAQSEAATGKRFVRLWFHVAHLQVDEEKMSKRIGNILTLDDVFAEPEGRPSTLRYLLAATAHYRRMLNYSTEALHHAAQAVERWALFRDRLEELQGGPGDDDEAVALAQTTRERFDAALDDDLNLPEAMGQVFAAIREANRLLDDDRVGRRGRAALLDLVAHADDVVGVLPLVDREREATLDETERDLLARRAEARARRDYATSDALRKELAARGIVVEDTPRGQRWRRVA